MFLAYIPSSCCTDENAGNPVLRDDSNEEAAPHLFASLVLLGDNPEERAVAGKWPVRQELAMRQSRHENAIGYGRSNKLASATQGVKIEEARIAEAEFARFFTSDSHRIPFSNHPWRFGVDRKSEWLRHAASSIH